jgi:hypothetical protein
MTEYPEVVARMSMESRWYLLAHLLRFPDLFAKAQSLLKPETLGGNDESHLRALWSAALAIANKHGTTSLFDDFTHAWGLVLTETRAYADLRPDEVIVEAADRLFNDHPKPGLITWIYSGIAAKELSQRWGLDLLTLFLQERYVQDPLVRALRSADDKLITNLPVLIREEEDRARDVSLIGQSPVLDVIPFDGWEPPTVAMQPTGIDFLDAILNGGHVNGETYGVLGPLAAGKTSLAGQLVAGSARLAPPEGLRKSPIRERHRCPRRSQRRWRA